MAKPCNGFWTKFPMTDADRSFLPALDATQLALDKHRLASEVHPVFKAGG